jgi:hypothetical protein
VVLFDLYKAGPGEGADRLKMQREISQAASVRTRRRCLRQ